jgi:spermidine/putrescine transport system substrate-binding protein
VHLTRRELLAAAAVGLITAGCGVDTSAGSDPQTVSPESVTAAGQPLDPRLTIAAPRSAIAESTLVDFERATKVKVVRVERAVTSQFLLQLAAGAQSKADSEVDVALVDDQALSYLISQGLAEPIDRSLIPNLQWLTPPFDNPPYDPRSAHSIGKDYTAIGFAVATDGVVSPPDTWSGFFKLAHDLPGTVAVPDDSEAVVGAALLASGHPWSSTSSSDLDDARKLLTRLRGSLVVEGGIDRSTLGSRRLAALSSGMGFRNAPLQTKFVVPTEGTAVLMRSYCILAMASDPVSAHAWLNDSLDPFVARRNVLANRLASPVSEVDYLLSSPAGQAILTNQAIYPPADVYDKLRFQTAAGSDARAALWDEVRA